MSWTVGTDAVNEKALMAVLADTTLSDQARKQELEILK
jgi:hypothetical protein